MQETIHRIKDRLWSHLRLWSWPKSYLQNWLVRWGMFITKVIPLGDVKLNYPLHRAQWRCWRLHWRQPKFSAIKKARGKLHQDRISNTPKTTVISLMPEPLINGPRTDVITFQKKDKHDFWWNNLPVYVHIDG